MRHLPLLTGLSVCLALAATPAPATEDAPTADPEHYSVAFENEHVRVLRVTYPPGEASVLHSHPGLVAIMLTPTEFEMTPEDGVSASMVTEAETVVWDDPVVHTPRNAGDSEARVVLVEVKGATNAPRASSEELLRGAYEAFAKGDVPGVLALLDDKVEWTEDSDGPYAGTYTGPNAVLEGVFTRLGGEWAEYRVVPSGFFSSGDRVVVIGDYHATHGETGKSMSAPFAHIWTVENGKVTRFRQLTEGDKIHAATR